MNIEATVVCAFCCTRVPVEEMDENHRCSVCREHHARTGRSGMDLDGQALGADAGVYVEELHGGVNALLDTREFDGGDQLADCDEV